MRVSVIVPTYRRTTDLEHCLHGMALQRRQPDELIVVIRSSDEESREALLGWAGESPRQSSLRVVEVEQGGQVTSLNAGLGAASGDIIMITDDDAVPREDWIARAEEHFRKDPRIGGVGGRDIVHLGDSILSGRCKRVGTVHWNGRITGNHHLELRSRRWVDILKGANMAFRSSAIQELQFDTELRGSGAQVGNDMAFSLSLRKNGWRLLYDPLVVVDHYPAPRFDNDQRGSVDFGAVENMAFNIWWTLMRHMPRGPRRLCALLWDRLIGTHGSPGLLRGLQARLKGDMHGRQMEAAARHGRKQASLHYASLCRK